MMASSTPFLLLLWVLCFCLYLVGIFSHARHVLVTDTAHHQPVQTHRLLHSDRPPLQTHRPFNIAHRGSNGELPEETAAAYLRAIDEGADFIETDILSTKDGILICFHDLILDDTTDIAAHSQFADRISTYEVQGSNITGWFVVDFTWEELQTLRTRQRYSFRDHSYDGKYPIISFEHFIEIAVNASRAVGIYPELKNPVFINEHVSWGNGKQFEDIFVETLLKYGYTGKYLSNLWRQKPLFIQSFAPTSLIYMSHLIDSPKILLIDGVTVPTQDTNQTYEEITSPGYLDYIKQYVVGIGPWKDTIVPPNSANYLGKPTDLVEIAHARGLEVHPYTYRNENVYLHFDFHQDPYQEYKYWIEVMKIDGLFTDFTGSLHLYQEWDSALTDSPAVALLDTIDHMINAYKHQYKHI